LAFALEQAHNRGLELHTWFNTFPAWRGAEPPPHTIPEQIYNAHPEWIVCDSAGKRMLLSEHYVSLSPGIPEARDYIHQVAMDIVTNYDIDGFHFDYIRYPEGADKLGYSQDPVSVRLFNTPDGNPKNLDWEDWQRENINQFVRQFYDEATSLKPWLKISAAVIGKYDYSSWNGYHIVFQDAKKWIDQKTMDFIVPMIYWQTNHPTAPYGTIVKNWFKLKHDRYIFPGMMINSLGSENWSLEEVVHQAAINRDGGNGMVFFSYSGLEKAKSQLKGDGFRYRANLPPMSWKDDQPPMDPQNLRVNILSTGNVLLIWSPPDSSIEPIDTHHYNIFRSEKRLVDFMNAENLIYITAKPDTFYVDTTIKPGRTYQYIVTALDRVNNESPPSNQVSVMIPQLALADGVAMKNSE
ncbi:MAG TPA: family 10 glycosylhydrolase, partial [bacterium]